MNARIALLRGINVGGHKMIAMADLRALVATLGFQDPRTLLQSGNMVFGSTSKKSDADIERLLEEETKARLGVEADFMVRAAEEWDALIARNPFPKEATKDPARLAVIVLKAAPTPAQVRTLQGAIVGRETLKADGRHAYVVYPDGMGTTKLTLTVIERHLATRGTARNWNTVLKLGALVHAVSAA